MDLKIQICDKYDSQISPCCVNVLINKIVKKIGTHLTKSDLLRSQKGHSRQPIKVNFFFFFTLVEMPWRRFYLNDSR